MKAAFSLAAIPEPYRVLGRNLQPFTLGHQILLERFESSFAVGSQKQADDSNIYGDLILSVFLCSFPFEEALRQLNSRFLKLKLWAWGKLCGRFDLLEAIEFFQTYIEEHSREPEFKVISNGNEAQFDSAIPFSQFLKVKLEQELGRSPAEALNTVYSAAIIDYLTAMEGKGLIRFVSEEEKALHEVANDPEVNARIEAWAKKVMASQGN